MTDLERLRCDGSELERELLSSALGDAPDARARQRVLGALGLGVAATAMPGTALATGIGAGVKTAGKVTLLGIAKWAGGGLVAGAITASTLGQVNSRHQRVAATESPAPSVVQPAPAKRPPVVAHVLETEEPPAPAMLPSPSKPFPPEELGRSNVTDEVRFLDGARAALDSGQAARALEAIERYRQQFPAGVLRPEADLVRLQAYARLGERSAVAARARAFLDNYPSSPHAPRVRALLERAEPAKPEAPTSSARSSSVARFPIGG